MALTSIIDFPVEMPKVSAREYGATPYADVVIFKPDSGPDIIRRRSGRVGMQHDISYTVSMAQRQIFLTFYEDVLFQGTQPFNWSDPYLGLRRTVRIEPNSLSITSLGPLASSITMRLQELSRA